MSKYTVTHACGHQITHQLLGKHLERDRKIAWLEKCKCRECEREAERNAAAAKAAEQQLSDLAGSDKQVAWAMTIRDKLLRSLKFEADAQLLRTSLRAKCEARWWIDRRDRTLQQIASEISAETDSAGRLLWRASVRGQRAGISSARCDR